MNKTMIRNEIDAIDSQLLKLFLKRMSLVKTIAVQKKENGLAIRDITRERQIIDRATLESGSMASYSKQLFKNILSLSRTYQTLLLTPKNELANGIKITKEVFMKILVINGPNINLLGIREPAIYGRETYQMLIERVNKKAKALNVEVICYQSNHEGQLIDKIQALYESIAGIIINPAAYTHTSIALLDTLKATRLPAVEVHLSEVKNRENYRQISYVGKYCEKTITGKGITGYEEALDYLVTKLK